MDPALADWLEYIPKVLHDDVVILLDVIEVDSGLDVEIAHHKSQVPLCLWNVDEAPLIKWNDIGVHRVLGEVEPCSMVDRVTTYAVVYVGGVVAGNPCALALHDGVETLQLELWSTAVPIA